MRQYLPINISLVIMFGRSNVNERLDPERDSSLVWDIMDRERRTSFKRFRTCGAFRPEKDFGTYFEKKRRPNSVGRGVGDTFRRPGTKTQDRLDRYEHGA